jgi:hypothetical protein
VSCINWNPIHDVGCGVKGVVGGVASVFDDVAQDFAHLAEHATAWVWSQLDTATAVKLSGASWDGVLQVTVELGVLVCVTMFLLQIIFSALRQEPGGMGRAVRGVMIAMIGMFAAFIITDSLLALVDSLSDGVMQALAGTTSWNALGSKVIHSNILTRDRLGRDVGRSADHADQQHRRLAGVDGPQDAGDHQRGVRPDRLWWRSL